MDLFIVTVIGIVIAGFAAGYVMQKSISRTSAARSEMFRRGLTNDSAGRDRSDAGGGIWYAAGGSAVGSGACHAATGGSAGSSDGGGSGSSGGGGCGGHGVGGCGGGAGGCGGGT